MTKSDPNKLRSKQGIDKSHGASMSPTPPVRIYTPIKVPLSTSTNSLAAKFDRVVKIGVESIPCGLCPSETYLG
jgi:hypothetical protein